MLGLKRGTVKLVPHNSRWKKSYAREAEKLRTIFGSDDLGIQHVGSTAIPGIPAKPIVDIAVAVPSLRAARRYIPALRRIGYQLKHEARTDRLFFAKGHERQRTHYLHVGSRRGQYVRDMVTFRDYLRSHPQVAARYAQLKRKLAGEYAGERPRYTSGKKKFIETVIKKAIDLHD